VGVCVCVDNRVVKPDVCRKLLWVPFWFMFMCDDNARYHFYLHSEKFYSRFKKIAITFNLLQNLKKVSNIAIHLF